MLITIDVIIDLPKEKIWDILTNPEHIVKWNFASDDWFCPNSAVDLRIGGKINSRMEAKDGSFGFDFWATYTEIETYKKLNTIMGDGRKWDISLTEENGKTKLTESFETESQNSTERQREGWQSILNNLKKYAETL